LILSGLFLNDCRRSGLNVPAAESHHRQDQQNQGSSDGNGKAHAIDSVTQGIMADVLVKGGKLLDAFKPVNQGREAIDHVGDNGQHGR
jgi:hypothetical protein